MALNVERLVARLVTLPGVVAVALGGSRARGEAHPDSDWDFGLYFRRAGFASADGLLAAPGADAAALNATVSAVEALLEIDDEQPPGVRPAR